MGYTTPMRKDKGKENESVSDAAKRQKTIKIRQCTLDKLRLLKRLSGGKIAMTELLDEMVTRKLGEYANSNYPVGWIKERLEIEKE